MYKIQASGYGFIIWDDMSYIRYENFVYNCLEWISIEECLDISDCISESHALTVLREQGIKIEFLEEDGSEMTW